LLQKFEALHAEIVEQEKAQFLPLDSEIFPVFVVKPDRKIRTQDQKIWLCEYKTTAGYGAKTASFYYNSMQTLTYMYVCSLLNPEVYGTKLFVFMKKGAKKTAEERVIIEDIVLTENDKRKAQLFITDAVKFAEKLEREEYFPRFMNNCYSYFGGTYPYIPLCINTDNPAYIEEATQMFFKVEDPEEHLELEGGE